MKFQCTVNGVSRDLLNNRWVISLNSGSKPDWVDEYLGKDLEAEIKPFRRHRSLSANAYYWLLLGQLARKQHCSNQFAHNLLLRRYGVPETEDGDMIYAQLPDNDEVMKRMCERDDIHMMPTTKVVKGKNGKYYRFWRMLKGSSHMDSFEFSRLVDGLISECKEVGIETIPPEELERLVGYVGVNYR